MESPYLALFFLSIANLLSTQPKGTDSSKALVSSTTRQKIDNDA